MTKLVSPKTGMRAAECDLLGMTAIAGMIPQQLRWPLLGLHKTGPVSSQSWTVRRDSQGPTFPCWTTDFTGFWRGRHCHWLNTQGRASQPGCNGQFQYPQPYRQFWLISVSHRTTKKDTKCREGGVYDRGWREMGEVGCGHRSNQNVVNIWDCQRTNVIKIHF